MRINNDRITVNKRKYERIKKEYDMFENQKVVGIVPTAPIYGKTDRLYNDIYKFTDTYCRRVTEAGMLPLGILPVQERLVSSSPELCDAFLIQGGEYPRPYHMDVIDHAVKTGKKVLGICLGCQCIQSYFAVKAEAEKRRWTGSLAELYDQLFEEGNCPFLVRVANHQKGPLLRLDPDAAKHKVILSEDSMLAKIFGRTEIMGASLHVLCIGEPAPGLTVTGRAEDGTVEAVEHGDTIIGVQFHPDVDTKLSEIFDWLAK